MHSKKITEKEGYGILTLIENVRLIGGQLEKLCSNSCKSRNFDCSSCPHVDTDSLRNKFWTLEGKGVSSPEVRRKLEGMCDRVVVIRGKSSDVLEISKGFGGRDA